MSHAKMSRPKLILVSTVVVVMGIVVFQNTEAVETELLFTTITMPRALLIAVSFLAGVLCGLLLANRRRHKKQAQEDD